jgi:glycosyltransferase involved in cell wall biosynthesis
LNNQRKLPANDVHITIVLPTYNRAPLLRQALASLVQQETGGKFSYDILVIDDGSTDQTAAVLQEVSQTAAGAPVTYLYQKNLGPYVSRNRGIEIARGNWLAFFDDDQWAEPGWLDELYQTAQERQADCVGGGVVCLDLPESAPGKLGPRARLLLNERPPGPKIHDRAVKDYIASGNVLIRRSVFEQAGSFDPIIQRGADTEFFWRIEQAGFRLAYAPQATIHHMIPESRLQSAYLRHLCLLTGVDNARIHWRYRGPLGLMGSNLWRLGVALGRDLPLLIIAAVGLHRPLALDSLLSLCYTTGFMRGSLFFLAPRLFPQKKFLAAFGCHVHGVAH